MLFRDIGWPYPIKHLDTVGGSLASVGLVEQHASLQGPPKDEAGGLGVKKAVG